SKRISSEWRGPAIQKHATQWQFRLWVRGKHTWRTSRFAVRLLSTPPLRDAGPAPASRPLVSWLKTDSAWIGSEALSQCDKSARYIRSGVHFLIVAEQ